MLTTIVSKADDSFVKIKVEILNDAQRVMGRMVCNIDRLSGQGEVSDLMTLTEQYMCDALDEYLDQNKGQYGIPQEVNIKW